jgi:hypothetical protein
MQTSESEEEELSFVVEGLLCEPVNFRSGSKAGVEQDVISIGTEIDCQVEF